MMVMAPLQRPAVPVGGEPDSNRSVHAPAPAETLFSVLKHRHFINRVLDSAEHVRETVEEVWNGFSPDTEKIMPITAGSWTVP